MKKLNLNLCFTLLFATFLLTQCKKNSPAPTPPPPVIKVPELSTDSANNVTLNNATIFAHVSSDGGSSVTARGICWGTSANPTITDTSVSSGTGTGSFTATITGLSYRAGYHVRAYATNSKGTSYGQDISFTTATPDISTQWTLKNLDVVTYRNGDSIPQVTDTLEWRNLTTGAWCYYQNDSTNGAEYGKLYNWYAVTDPRGLAPAGWQIPSKEEWTYLVNFLGGDDIAGGKLKTTNLWQAPNTGATDELGFGGKPGGFRSELGGFALLGQTTFLWSNKEHDATTAVERSLEYNNSSCFMYYYDKRCAMSVRCISIK